jgi:hypothetical protein
MTNVITFTSRQFLVGQAVLNAANAFYPHGVRKKGVAVILRLLVRGDPRALNDFHGEVIAQYQKLTGTYSEADDCAFTDPDFAAAVNGFAEFHA